MDSCPLVTFVSDIAIFVLKGDVKLQLTNARADGFVQCVCGSVKLVVHNFYSKSSTVCFFIFVEVFLDESSGRKSFRFLQVLIKMLSPEFNIFPYSMSLHYYYT